MPDDDMLSIIAEELELLRSDELELSEEVGQAIDEDGLSDADELLSVCCANPGTVPAARDGDAFVKGEIRSPTGLRQCNPFISQGLLSTVGQPGALMPIQVLVVEDEPLVRMAICLHLEECGFAVLEAANADEAIALLERHGSIHLVFTDIDMPGSMDGLKLAAFVRDRWPPIRIIVTSGKRMVEVTYLPDGSMFFAKPYGLDAVSAAFHELAATNSRRN
jgi:CheY-like chemotaxis protein